MKQCDIELKETINCLNNTLVNVGSSVQQSVGPFSQMIN